MEEKSDLELSWNVSLGIIFRVSQAGLPVFSSKLARLVNETADAKVAYRKVSDKKLLISEAPRFRPLGRAIRRKPEEQKPEREPWDDPEPMDMEEP